MVGTIQIGIFVWQLWLIRKSLVDTKVAADAAKTNADAVMLSERAYVQMSHVQPGLIIKPGGGMCRVQMRIKNFGRTPARITAEVLNVTPHIQGEQFPVAPEYRIPTGRDSVKAFLLTGDEIFAWEVFESMVIDTSKLNSGEQVLLMFGYVDYIDIFNRHHRTGYARHYRPRPDGDNLAYVAQSGYNYDRERKKGDGNDWDEPKA